MATVFFPRVVPKPLLRAAQRREWCRSRGPRRRVVAQRGRPSWRMLVLLGLLPLMPPVPKRPPVARERVIPRTPAGPPWKLISQRASAMSSKIARRSKLSERRWSSTCSTSITCSGSRKATPHSRCTSTIDWQPHHLFLFLKRHGGDGELVGVLGGPGTGRSKAESAKWPRASVARADGKNVRMHFVLF